MSRKEKTLEKWKNFFSRRDTTSIDFEGMRVDPYVVELGTLKDISVENSVSHRLKSLKDLYEPVLTKKLADYAVESICKQIEDLLSPHQSAETRHIVFQFYIALINGQLYYMQIMRTYLFRLIVQHNIAEDILPRLDMLKALSENGKTITNFEEEIGPLLLTWFPGFMNIGKVTEFLTLVTNVIKFNAAYLDDNVVEGYIRYILTLVCKTKFLEDLQECLNILEAILCYSHLPQTVLQAFVTILCCTVNIESLVPCSLKQMRNLLGTNIGHTGIFTLCVILQDVNNYKNPKLVRGAVFFIGMALWSEHKVLTLSHPPTAILPSFFKVLESNEIIIVYEVVLALNRLVTECGDQLYNRSNLWDAIFTILEKVFIFVESQPNSQTVIKSLNDLLSVAEKDCPEDSHESLFRIIEMCSDYRNEQSVKKLIVYKSEQLKWYKPNFSANLNLLLEKFFKNEKRSAVQLETLNVVRNARKINASFFEDDIIDQAILQNMSNTDAIPDSSVRKGVVQLLISMLESSKTRWFLDILEVIEKIMKRMFENPLEKGYTVASDSTKDSNSDVVAAVEGLVHAFKGKLFCMPSSQCIEIFSLLVKHINQHYEKQLTYTEEAVQTRKLILEFFFQIRANRHRQIGVYSNAGTDYSLYILCDTGNIDGIESPPTSPPPSSPSSLMPTISYLSYNKAYKVIITCLKEERDWPILEMVLKHIPVMLQNKTLIVKGNCSVSTLCSTLCNLIKERNDRFPDSLKNTPPRLTRTDVQGKIFPCVASLTSYHSNLESHVQRILIKCLQFGLVSRSAKICMEGLTLCILEMQNSMIKLLPDVLLNLSKISATKIVAVSVLEFLSNLIRLPHLYVSFVEDQYMSIFAIALPYTNPFKFNLYTVALAHHVLSMWFLKCRIPFRRDFAKFITKGLRSNLNVPLENQSSSSRSDEGTSSEMTNSAILALHTEFMETGLDLMARFTFGMCTNVPQRSPVAEFLLENGQKSSWLVGNKIVTITTSGCGTKSFKQGLCERCYTSSHELNKNIDPESMGDNESIVDENDSIFMEPEATVETRSSEKFSLERKRHRSAIQGTHTTHSKEVLMESNKTKDDIRLHYQKFRETNAVARRHTYVPDTDRMSTIKSMESSSKSKDSDKSGQLCSCWCTSWAEVHIRRPTGNTSWMMKMNNQVFLPSNPLDVPLSVLNSLILPQIEKEDQISFQSSADNEDLDVVESEFKLSCSKAIDIVPSQRSVPPMRRTNSSPDMNTGWLLSTDREPKQSTFESSAESERSHMAVNEELASGSSKQSSLSKQAQQQPPMPSSFRDRGHTISVMSPNRPTGSENLAKAPEVSQRSGISPSFVFLQLFHNSSFGPATYKPLLLQQTETNTRALTVLDHIPPYDTHKIGIVYVGPGQAEDEVAILSNIYGSARYVEFLKGLGEIVDLSESDPHTTYLGGLDTRGEDGTFALIWHDDVMQVVFHVATFMINKESDKNRNEKKKHIANDGVMIVYNESGEDFKLSTIKGHVTNACIVIKPEDFNSNIVSVKYKTKELADTFGHTESYIVSDPSLPVFVRQMALHANLAALLITRRQQSTKYAQVSNWLERLRTIKRLRSKVLDEIKKKNENFGFESSFDVADYDDFTDYV
ncbi:hypothetical protein JTE90_003050 [Oedothorax gibbosus]|uniref:Rap-GAP domain-containing protein n=1 Tax=Oedothorax gibbosus TaxID=931172 RepID=A0AAV6VBQ7_9ARAC|nr:hypothetical protein JTE90_003050 [Oedothorax gibbosus]